MLTRRGPSAGGSAVRAKLRHGLPGQARQGRRKERKKKSDAKRRQTQLVFCRGSGHGRAWSAKRTSTLRVVVSANTPCPVPPALQIEPNFSIVAAAAKVFTRPNQSGGLDLVGVLLSAFTRLYNLSRGIQSATAHTSKTIKTPIAA